MQNLKLIIFSFALIIASCKSGTGQFKTSNGYSYEIHKAGSGAPAKMNDYLFYTMSIKVDSTVVQEFKDLNQLPSIKLEEKLKEDKKQIHFFEMLSKAKVGDSISLYIPVDSLPKGNPMLEGKKRLIYTFAFKNIMDSVKYNQFIAGEKTKQEAKMKVVQQRAGEVEKTLMETLNGYKAKTLKVETTSSGLKYFIHEKGNGPNIKSGEEASVNYHGVLLNGTEFDNSFKRGEPITFPVGVGQVIKGWDEALLLLPKGTKATIFVPSQLGYGENSQAPIPPNSELIFYIEIL
ncbi:MAG: hypothetical protein RLZZ546_2213 [Bacteroidota bacterium]|jgi:FKBP-type peptidyl-prolyl cis-trans isomerase